MRGPSRFIAALITSVVVASPFVEARQSGAPLAPTLLPASVVGNVVTLSWIPNASGGAPTTYQLRAGSAPGLTDIALLSLQPHQTTLIVGAPNGIYYVRMVAANAAGVSPESNEIAVVVGAPPGCVLPGVPTDLTASTFAGGVTLSWRAPSSGGVPTNYHLLAGSTPGGVDVGNFPVGATTTVTTPAPAGQYFVRVVARNACGSSAPSNEVSFVVGGIAAPPVPAGRYFGAVSNFTRSGVAPIRNFTLELNQPVPATSTFQALPGRWTDNRGCIKATGIVGATTATGATISLENFTCNDGDFTLRVTRSSANVYIGVCPLGGPNCTFEMIRVP